MKSLKKQQRIQVMAVLTVALILSTVLIGYALRDGINLFRTPTQILAEPPAADEVFRIGGLVATGSLVVTEGETVLFDVTDGNATVAVEYTGVLPDLFGEDEGMVGTGRWENDVFLATEILARHDETYMPRELIEALEEQGVYRETQEQAAY